MAHDQDSFRDHLAAMYGLDVPTAGRIIAECAAYWNQDTETWIRQRHLELRNAGQDNTEIFHRLEKELASRPFAAPPLSQRQLRRRIYG